MTRIPDGFETDQRPEQKLDDASSVRTPGFSLAEIEWWKSAEAGTAMITMVIRNPQVFQFAKVWQPLNFDVTRSVC